MSRRTVTLAVAGFLVVLLSAVAALLPVPYVALSPGPTANTLGTVDKTELIRIDGRKTYPDNGHLDLTTVSVLGGPRQRLDLVTALRGWLDDEIAVLPEERVYPEDETAEEVKEEGVMQMRESQENATTSALRHLDIPVVTRVLVDSLAPSSPSEGKLRAGDQIVSVDGKPAAGGAALRALITAHEAGDEVRLVVLRNGKRVAATVTTGKAPEDGRAVIGISTRDEADVPVQGRHLARGRRRPERGADVRPRHRRQADAGLADRRSVRRRHRHHRRHGQRRGRSAASRRRWPAPARRGPRTSSRRPTTAREAARRHPQGPAGGPGGHPRLGRRRAGRVAPGRSGCGQGPELHQLTGRPAYLSR